MQRLPSHKLAQRLCYSQTPSDPRNWNVFEERNFQKFLPGLHDNRGQRGTDSVFIVVEDSSSDGQVVFHGGAGELGGVHQAKPSLPEPIGWGPVSWTTWVPCNRAFIRIGGKSNDLEWRKVHPRHLSIRGVMLNLTRTASARVGFPLRLWLSVAVLVPSVGLAQAQGVPVAVSVAGGTDVNIRMMWGKSSSTWSRTPVSGTEWCWLVRRLLELGSQDGLLGSLQLLGVPGHMLLQPAHSHQCWEPIANIISDNWSYVLPAELPCSRPLHRSKHIPVARLDAAEERLLQKSRPRRWRESAAAAAESAAPRCLEPGLMCCPLRSRTFHWCPMGRNWIEVDQTLRARSASPPLIYRHCLALAYQHLSNISNDNNSQHIPTRLLTSNFLTL